MSKFLSLFSKPWLIGGIVAVLYGVLLFTLGSAGDPEAGEETELLAFDLLLIIFTTGPFVVLSLLTKSVHGKSDAAMVPSRYGLIGAWVGLLATTVFLIISYFLDLSSENPSSTAALIFLFLPVYICLAAIVGFASGWLLGSLSKGRSDGAK